MASENPQSQFSSTNLSSTQFPSHLPTAPASPHYEAGPPLPSPKASATLQSLSKLLSSSDRTLVRISKILSTPAGQDTTLSAVCYTLTLLQATINTTLEAQLESIVKRFAEKAFIAMNPGETIIATIKAPAIASLLVRLSTSSKTLASKISDYRTFVRLWGLLSIYAWAKSVYRAPPKDTLLRCIAYTQVATNLCFQSLENRGFLALHGIIARPADKIGRDFLWSARFWAFHVALDFVKLYRVSQLWDAPEPGKDTNDAEVKLKKETDKATWRRQLLVDLCFAPMTIHWSRKGGLLNETQVGILGTIAGWTSLRQQWIKSA